MRLTVKEDETVDEVDLSRKYFSLQMKGLLDKAAKSIRICVASRRYWYSQSRKHG